MKKIIVCSSDKKIVSELSGRIEEMVSEQFRVDRYISARQMVYEIEDEFLETADLFFLDLDMQDMDIIQAAKILQKKLHSAKLVFVTGVLDRMEEIFDGIRPFGILLKPVKEKRLKKYIQEAFADRQGGGEETYIEIKKNGRIRCVLADEIFYVESMGRKLLIHKKKETECIYERISNFCILYGEDFVRCHQSYAVNWKYVAEISASGVVLTNGRTVPVSRQKYREIRARAGH